MGLKIWMREAYFDPFAPVLRETIEVNVKVNHYYRPEVLGYSGTAAYLIE